MKRTIVLAVIVLLPLFTIVVSAQTDRKVQNRPYIDLRKLHFGVVVGTHLQDLELINTGPITCVDDDGNAHDALVMVDQDRWEPGFNVGVMAEVRLHDNVQFRVSPMMYFGNRHIQFRDIIDSDNIKEEHQNMKTAYIACSADLVFAAQRHNNHRPFIFAGLTPAINLSGNSDDILKLKRYDLFFEVGLGCNYYLPFFKLRPELKFMYGLGNSLDMGHADKISDKNLLGYARSVKPTHTKMVTLCFTFE